MEPISLNLLADSSPRMLFLHRGSYILLGALNIIQGFLLDGKFGYFIMGGGAIFLFGGIFYNLLFSTKPIIFDENGVEGPVGGKPGVRIGWSEISRIEETMFSLTIVTTAGDSRTIDLSGITYAQHKELKPKIIQLAISKGIEVRTV
jgi:hypothetical protein